MGDTCGAGAQAEIEGVFSSKSPIETPNGTTWVPESFEIRAPTRVQARVDMIQIPSAEGARIYSRSGLQLKNPDLIAVCCWLTPTREGLFSRAITIALQGLVAGRGYRHECRHGRTEQKGEQSCHSTRYQRFSHSALYPCPSALYPCPSANGESDVGLPVYM
eukprot:COSAG05_NODE_48_length_24425_cov_90.438543_26_plen_162_part_00